MREWRLHRFPAAPDASARPQETRPMTFTEAVVDAPRPESPDPALSDADSPDSEVPETKTWFQQILLVLFITLPFVALAAAIPVLWGRGLGWRDAVIAVFMYGL